MDLADRRTKAAAAAPPAAPAPPVRPAAPDPLVGSLVGSFRIQKLLGRGGMGTVYLGEHPIIGSRVAIKFLHESMCASPELVARFYDEARAVNLIGHENIVAIYDLAQLPPSRYYIVMEYLDGAPLSALLREGRLDTPVAIRVLLQLADALQAAHDHGIVHRDLKPENVFVLRRAGREFVKLVDFGIAKLADRTTSARTATGSIVGTPEYMAPEQCDNRPIDRRTDVYALGIMAYELFTGQLPFTMPSIAQILLAQVGQAPAPPRSLQPALSPAIEAAILKALHKRPDDRFQDMRAFAAALSAALDAHPEPRAAAASPAAAPDAREEEVMVVVPGAGPRPCRAREAARGGLFLRTDGELPSLRARVSIALPGAGGAPVDVPGEVVRHVSAADASRWRMPPGFAVQLGALSAPQRAAVDALAARLAKPTSAAARAAPPPLGLEELERRAAAGPYEMLDAPPEAGFPEIRERARAVRQQVEALRASLPAGASATRVPALLARIDAAAAQLGTPGERLMFDARRGNFHGVAHCVTAGAPPAVVEARRRAFLAEHPGHAERAQRHLARARVAAKLGNREAALAEYEAALTADPLDLGLHETYWKAKRGA